MKFRRSDEHNCGALYKVIRCRSEYTEQLVETLTVEEAAVLAAKLLQYAATGIVPEDYS